MDSTQKTGRQIISAFIILHLLLQYTSAWPGSFSARLVSLLERRGSGDNHEGEGLDCSQVPSVRAAMLQSITALGSGEGEEGMANVAPEVIVVVGGGGGGG